MTCKSRNERSPTTLGPASKIPSPACCCIASYFSASIRFVHQVPLSVSLPHPLPVLISSKHRGPVSTWSNVDLLAAPIIWVLSPSLHNSSHTFKLERVSHDMYVAYLSRAFVGWLFSIVCPVLTACPQGLDRHILGTWLNHILCGGTEPPSPESPHDDASLSSAFWWRTYSVHRLMLCSFYDCALCDSTETSDSSRTREVLCPQVPYLRLCWTQPLLLHHPHCLTHTRNAWSLAQ
jgi:hypothetical protein